MNPEIRMGYSTTWKIMLFMKVFVEIKTLKKLNVKVSVHLSPHRVAGGEGAGRHRLAKGGGSGRAF